MKCLCAQAQECERHPHNFRFGRDGVAHFDCRKCGKKNLSLVDNYHCWDCMSKYCKECWDFHEFDGCPEDA
jgi:hypothetical protein